MNHQFKMLRYNTAQSNHSMLQLDSLDETIPYTLSLNMQPKPLTLWMVKPAYNERMYLLVTWS